MEMKVFLVLVCTLDLTSCLHNKTTANWTPSDHKRRKPSAFEEIGNGDYYKVNNNKRTEFQEHLENWSGKIGKIGENRENWSVREMKKDHEHYNKSGIIIEHFDDKVAIKSKESFENTRQFTTVSSARDNTDIENKLNLTNHITRVLPNPQYNLKTQFEVDKDNKTINNFSKRPEVDKMQKRTFNLMRWFGFRKRQHYTQVGEIHGPYIEKDILVPTKMDLLDHPIISLNMQNTYRVPFVKNIHYPVKDYAPKPYPTYKHIPYFIQTIVEKHVPVPVSKPYPVFIENKVPYPVEKRILYPVKIPVDRPYPVHVPVLNHIYYPSEKRVVYPVPVTVEKPVPRTVESHYPVFIEKQVPVTVEKHVLFPVPVDKHEHFGEHASNNHETVKIESSILPNQFKGESHDNLSYNIEKYEEETSIDIPSESVFNQGETNFTTLENKKDIGGRFYVMQHNSTKEDNVVKINFPISPATKNKTIILNSKGKKNL